MIMYKNEIEVHIQNNLFIKVSSDLLQRKKRKHGMTIKSTLKTIREIQIFRDRQEIKLDLIDFE